MTKNTIFILGKNGQVANALHESLVAERQKLDYHFLSSGDLDFSKPEDLSLKLNQLPNNIAFIVNAMAYTNVDRAEDEQELCDKINHRAVKILADYCFQKQIKLIHYSTDYVFDGTGTEPFAEDNTKNLNPVNFYGKTKLWGEQAIQQSGADYLIIRISWVYDNCETSKNFVNTIKRLARDQEVLRIVDDQIGSPTSAEFIAKNTLKIIKEILDHKNNKNPLSPEFIDLKAITENKYHKKIIHLNNGRFISWYEFALEIFAFLKRSQEIIKLKEIVPIKTSEYKTRAVRPLNSRIASNKLYNFV